MDMKWTRLTFYCSSPSGEEAGLSTFYFLIKKKEKSCPKTTYFLYKQRQCSLVERGDTSVSNRLHIFLGAGDTSASKAHSRKGPSQQGNTNGTIQLIYFSSDKHKNICNCPLGSITS